MMTTVKEGETNDGKANKNAGLEKNKVQSVQLADQLEDLFFCYETTERMIAAVALDSQKERTKKQTTKKKRKHEGQSKKESVELRLVDVVEHRHRVQNEDVRKRMRKTRRENVCIVHTEIQEQRDLLDDAPSDDEGTETGKKRNKEEEKRKNKSK